MRQRWRYAVPAIAAVLLACGVLLAPPTALPAHAAGRLAYSSTATYTVSPARNAVEVSVKVTATNLQPNTASTVYWYSGMYLNIHEEASRVRISGTSRLELRRSGGRLYADVTFGKRLYYRQSTTFTVSYDLRGAPRSRTPIRTSDAFFTFYAWSFSDNGTVRVVVPRSYVVESTGSQLQRTQGSSGTILSATRTGPSRSFYATITAVNPAALRRTSTEVDVRGARRAVTILTWPEDAAWLARTRDILGRGIPALAELSGLGWPLRSPLTVTEVYSSQIDGYGGTYTSGTIRMSDEMDAHLALHEAAHIWFDGTRFTDRWVTEGLADVFASLAVDRLGLADEERDRVAPTDKAAFRLSTWPDPGGLDDEATRAREDYGYSASWLVVGSIVEAAGLERFREVLGAAEEMRIAYGAEGMPRERYSRLRDWRYLLDLVEEIGRAPDATDLIRRWVATESEVAQLDRRAEARTAYHALRVHAGSWRQPLRIRQLMASWAFRDAEASMLVAEHVLRDVAAVRARATDGGTKLPDSMRIAYETTESDFRVLDTLVSEVRSALDELEVARRAIAASRSDLELVGFRTEPEDLLERVRGAIAQGNLSAARARAAEAASLPVAAAPVARAIESVQRDRAVLDQAGVLPLAGSLIDEARSGLRAGTRPAVRSALDRLAALREAAPILVAAAGRLGQQRSSMVELGLLGGDEPRTMLDAARAALARGDTVEATRLARASTASLDAAEALGRERVLVAGVAGGSMFSIFLLGGGTVLVVRRRRRTARAALGLDPASDSVPIAAQVPDPSLAVDARTGGRSE